MAKRYKYKCRECIPRVRNMCIGEAQISPGAKRIIERAFESHTDTEATWDLLQSTCMLIRRDEMVIDDPTPNRGGGLLGRMQRQAAEADAALPPSPPPSTLPAREKPVTAPVVRAPEPGGGSGLLGRLQERQQQDDEEPTPVVSPPPATGLARERPRHEHVQTAPARPLRFKPGSSLLGRLAVQEELSRSGAQRSSSADLSDSSPVAELEVPLEVRYIPVTRPTPAALQMPGPKMLVVESTGHRILLPENGELVFGRLDPLNQIRPDIDLTFEDRVYQGISRRHASVNGWHGRYELIDLGSSNGTWLNGSRMPLQQAPVLQVGDEVRLGQCVMFFDVTPEVYRDPPADGQYFFYVTYTGRFFALPNKGVLTIGRADPALGYVPDIDLSDEGESASVVSRHHAKLIRTEGQFLVEDLGSAFKTKIDGQPVYVGSRMPIQPGQHLWLGGCVLAFDVM
jgi:pSer/pThr/pTyr-binding forkhead associated (FHA) protein